MRRFIAAILYLLLVILPSLLIKDNDSWGWVIRAGVVFAVTLIVFWAERPAYRKARYTSVGVLFLATLAAYGKIQVDWLAWVLVVVWFAGLLLLTRRFILPHNVKSILWTIVLWTIFSGFAGGVLALVYALFTNFSEEEFFIAVTGVVLGVFWLILAIAYQLAFSTFIQTLPLKMRIRLFTILIIISVGFVPWVLKQYQRSFFPVTAPSYAGISENTPFLCATLDASRQPIPATQIQSDYLALLKAAPQKNTLIWGNLAYYTGDTSYAIEFRRSLLQDAAERRYTTPAQSVKWGQYEAALRAHQLALISKKFPTLFSKDDWHVLQNWFAAINRRAMTTEWVDWLYAAAYGNRPQGPYENQEIGAGLLAVLMNNDWAAPGLVGQNRMYLNNVPLGWQNIFRNTDDSYSYQGVWLSNAWWIYNYRKTHSDVVHRNIEQSFQWLLLQALPTGETLTYNINGEPTSLTTYLFGASLLNNPELSWLAGENAQWLLGENQHLWGEFTIPNFNFPDGQVPTVGSCLMYGNSGVPTRKGPLGPDKVVLRDGWADNAMVAITDLRFTGWHRYKATNTIPLIYSNGPIVSERESAEAFWWLPVGRSAFRDKRIPREYLNGLLLPKSGLPAVMWRLTGIGSKWAQNPPAYAEVNTFFTGDSVDIAQTTLPDWNGWQHTRTTYLIHSGVTVVVDTATNDNATNPASVVWHLNGSGERKSNGLNLADGHHSAKMMWLTEETGTIKQTAIPTTTSYLRSPNWEWLYTSPTTKNLNLATAFVANDIAPSDLSLHHIDGTRGVGIHYVDDTVEVTMMHNNEQVFLQDDVLGTDGLAAWFTIRQAERQVCIVDGRKVSIKIKTPMSEILTTNGTPVPTDVEWAVKDDWLNIKMNQAGSACFKVR